MEIHSVSCSHVSSNFHAPTLKRLHVSSRIIHNPIYTSPLTRLNILVYLWTPQPSQGKACLATLPLLIALCVEICGASLFGTPTGIRGASLLDTETGLSRVRGAGAESCGAQLLAGAAGGEVSGVLAVED